MLFFTQKSVLTATASRVIEAADVDRWVIPVEQTSQGSVLGFTDTTVEIPIPGTSYTGFEFVLPAGVELWARASGTAAELYIMVTNTRQ